MVHGSINLPNVLFEYHQEIQIHLMLLIETIISCCRRPFDHIHLCVKIDDTCGLTFYVDVNITLASFL